MKSWTRWQDWSNLVLGIYLMCVPAFTIDASDDSTLWSAEVFGIVIALTAIWALAQPASRTAEATQIVVAALLVLAPFVLGYTELTGAAANAYVVGGLTLLLAVWGAVLAAGGPRVTSHLGGTDRFV